MELSDVKTGVLCIPKRAFKSIVHNKKLFEDTNGKEVTYVVNTFNIGSLVATIQVNGDYFLGT